MLDEPPICVPAPPPAPPLFNAASCVPAGVELGMSVAPVRIGANFGDRGATSTPLGTLPPPSGGFCTADWKVIVAVGELI